MIMKINAISKLDINIICVDIFLCMYVFAYIFVLLGHIKIFGSFRDRQRTRLLKLSLLQITAFLPHRLIIEI